jgi:xanthine dehydrogenase FAD-binding subunit
LRSVVYHRAASIQGILDELIKIKGPKALLAGGTDLMIYLRYHQGRPLHLIDISGIKELSGIRRQNGKIWIGPLTTMADLASAPLIQEYIPVLSKSAASVGSPQIRNRATVGGNLCHASPCADTVPPLIALDAILELQSPKGIRQLPLEKFLLEPYRVALNPDELLVGIHIPLPTPNLKMTFYKLGRRKALSIARLNLVVGLEIDDGFITSAILSPGSILPHPRRLRSLEQKLINQKPTLDLFQSIGAEVSELMVKETGVRWSTPYKKPVVAALFARCLQQCLEGNQ